MKVQVTQPDEQVTVVSLEGEIGFSEVAEMEQGLGQALGTERPIVVDLARVTFIASDGLGALIRAHTRARDRRLRLVLVQPQPHILDLLRKTHLTRFFELHNNLEEARAALK